MDTRQALRNISRFTAACLVIGFIAGCGGDGSDSGPGPVPAPAANDPGTGRLNVTVTDPEGRTVANAAVQLRHLVPTRRVSTQQTSANGTTEFRRLPSVVEIDVIHEFGRSSVGSVDVAQSGTTALDVMLPANRPRPAIAVMPVEVLPGSVSADRSEFTIRVTVFASPSAPFNNDRDPATSTPVLVVGLNENLWDWYAEYCSLYRSPDHPVASCEDSGTGPHVMSAQRFDYAAAAPSPFAAAAGTVRSSMLLLDQSRRMSDLDPGAFRSFAARRFIERIARSADAGSLAIAGFAAAGGGTNTPLLLPQQPLWLPLGAGTPFSRDEALLKSNVQVIEPLLGGIAPVYAGIEAAVAQTDSVTPAGSRTVVVMLGGQDEITGSATERAQALATLRQQRDATGVRTILIGGTRESNDEIDELARALRAPRIPLPGNVNYQQNYVQAIASGATSALALAAELIEGVPLPTMSADIRIRKQTGSYPAGAALGGYVWLDTQFCSIGCKPISAEFTVVVP